MSTWLSPVGEILSLRSASRYSDAFNLCRCAVMGEYRGVELCGFEIA
jgi:hypothetical protein